MKRSTHPNILALEVEERDHIQGQQTRQSRWWSTVTISVLTVAKPTTLLRTFSGSLVTICALSSVIFP
jgi:hypothetical protein